MTERTPAQWSHLFRRVFLAFTAAGVAGTTVELALLRHWDSAVAMIPWVALAALAAGLGAVTFKPNDRTFTAVRMIAAAVAVSALYGVVQHVTANHAAGPLDFRYASRWESMSAASQWWAALSQSVGPAPTLAPLILAQTASCLWLATLGGNRPPAAVKAGSHGIPRLLTEDSQRAGR